MVSKTSKPPPPPAPPSPYPRPPCPLSPNPFPQKQSAAYQPHKPIECKFSAFFAVIICLQDPSLQMPFSSDYRPRFCMETGDLDLRVTAANDAALQCNLSLYRLECAEHLPVSGQEAAPAAATLAEVSSGYSSPLVIWCFESLPMQMSSCRCESETRLRVYIEL